MSYRKFTVDNSVCSRRFHISYDDENPAQSQVKVECPHCGITVFAASNHPKVILAREENLVKTVHLSEIQMEKCDMVDRFSHDTIPELKGKPIQGIYSPKT